MIFGYLHAPHRPGKVTPRGHPVPQLVEVIPPLLLEQADADRVHARRPLIGPDLLPRLKDEALTDLKRLHFRPGSHRRLLPFRVGPRLTLVCTAPSLQPHYRAFLTTTGRPAPVPRPGTLPLAVSAACGPPSRNRGHLPRPSLSGRQVLLFHASACRELTPPLHRAPPGQHTGRPLAEGARHQARAFVPGTLILPGFDAIVPPIDASAVVHTRSSSRRPPDPLTAGLFPQRSPPRPLTGAACGGLGSPPALASPEGQTSITGTARFVPTTFYIASLPFQDTHQNGGSARVTSPWVGSALELLCRLTGLSVRRLPRTASLRGTPAAVLAFGVVSWAWGRTN